jgi:hypothetical protein
MCTWTGRRIRRRRYAFFRHLQFLGESVVLDYWGYILTFLLAIIKEIHMWENIRKF